VVVPTSVLIVDDDAAFRGLALRILRASGLNVVGEAATIAAGMEAALRLRPDAMLVDIHLPDGSGIELARAFLTLAWTPRVLLTSSDHVSSEEIAGDGAGPALAFVAKDELSTVPLGPFLAVG
jgi:DNA-binding NarL/FixJ family response regulator